MLYNNKKYRNNKIEIIDEYENKKMLVINISINSIIMEII